MVYCNQFFNRQNGQIVFPCIKFPSLHFVHYTKLYNTVAVHFCISDFSCNFSMCDQLTHFFSLLLIFSNISISSPMSYKYFSWVLNLRLPAWLTLFTQTSRVQTTGQNFQILSKIFDIKISLPYLDAAWKMHSNEYKQAYYWSSDSWDSPWIWRKSSKFQIFLTQICSKHVKHKLQIWKLQTPAKNAVFW